MESWLFAYGAQAGYIIFTSIIFAESGILIGAFFPGDSLLVSAGVAASQGFFSISTLWILGVSAAILGDSVGYWFGSHVGRALFTKKRRFLRPEHLRKTEAYYEKWGAITVVLARFIPMARTLAPILAGTGKMSYGKFLTYNIFGGLLWVSAMLGIGYLFGEVAGSHVDSLLLPLIGGIVTLSLLPVIIGWIKVRIASKQ